MNGRKIKIIPEPTLRRLPIYHHYLVERRSEMLKDISCTKIADDLGLVSVQVRKDIEITGIKGRPKLGYDVDELIDSIAKFLGWQDNNDAFLVGTGNLGKALLGYDGFNKYGLNIVAAFDRDKTKVGKKVNNREVLDLLKFRNMVQRMKIRIGILTVPAQSVQEVAELMVEAGIMAIWNFAPSHINVPDNVVVQHENLAASFAVLSKKLSTFDQAGLNHD